MVKIGTSDELLKNAVRVTLQSLTGKVGINNSSGQDLLNLLKNNTHIDFKEVLQRGRELYDGATLYPRLSYWGKVVQDVARSRRIKGHSLVESDRPSDEERARVEAMAKDLADKFAFESEGNNKNLLTEKVKRYRQYVKDDLVRVDDYRSELNSTWIFRSQAVGSELKFHCPKAWLDKRDIVCEQVVRLHRGAK